MSPDWTGELVVRNHVWELVGAAVAALVAIVGIVEVLRGDMDAAVSYFFWAAIAVIVTVLGVAVRRSVR